MKKLIALLLCLVLTAALAAPALGDVLWEPADDFYWEHADECVRSDEGFMARSDTVLWKSPVEDEPAGMLTAGDNVLTPYIWTDRDGEEWGYAEFYEDGTWSQGWINLTRPDAAPTHTTARTASMVITLLVMVIAVTAAIILLSVLRRRKAGAE